MNDAHRWRVSTKILQGVFTFLVGFAELGESKNRNNICFSLFSASDGMQQIPYPKEWPAVLARRLGPPFQPAIVARCHTKSKRTQSSTHTEPNQSAT